MKVPMEQSDVWEEYVAHQQGYERPFSRSERPKRKKQKEKAPPPKLDHIDPHTVGRFDAKQWEKLSRPWSWMLGARQMLVEGAYKTVDPEEISHMPHVVCSCDLLWQIV